MKADIIAVGSEMLTPHRQDTNSLYLTAQLNKLGVDVVAKSIVGDNLKLLTSAVKQALNRADIVFTSGGLGPTMDDLTREAVAAALNLELSRDHDVLAALYKRFAERRITMPPNNARQADVVRGAQLLENSKGTAPGQYLDTVWSGHRKLLILLPGPPDEMKTMFERAVAPKLRETIPARHIATRQLRMALLPESQVDARTAPIYTQYKDVETTILAGQGEIQLHFLCGATSAERAKERVDELCGRIEDELGDDVFSSEGESLEQVVLYFLEIKGATLATAESCTGGMVAERITSVPGSSRSFAGGAVVYSNELKRDFAGVPAEVLKQHGPVSRATSAALAEGIRKRTKATLGIGVTGYAGPGGGTERTPLGTVFVALADEEDTQVVERRFLGDRDRVRLFATMLALDLVRRKLM